MNSSATISSAKELSPSEQAALIKLLADDDPAVYQLVREKILSCGPGAGEWLRPHALSSEPETASTFGYGLLILGMLLRMPTTVCRICTASRAWYELGIGAVGASDRA